MANYIIDKPIIGYLVDVRFEEEHGEENLRDWLHRETIFAMFPTYDAAAVIANGILLDYAEAIYDVESIEEPLKSLVLERDHVDQYAKENFHVPCGWWCTLLRARVNIIAVVEA